ncbi:necrosis inducing protein-domain-containing protein [Podospora australis]|uniref:Necrosis inducing protein-domain-containing protein n=1 Tax=Podospora australis TaxID=1536484 RepID=A0AAN6WK92_9PEZI|nr:necrosis inducing protein-domain-containing protein [Podospora australis]
MHSLAAAAVLIGTAFSGTAMANPIEAAPTLDALPSGTVVGALLSTPRVTWEDVFVDLPANNNTLAARDIRAPLPNRAWDIEHRFQPVTDFDKDGCYYTAAIDPSGNLNGGLGTSGCPHHDCRELSRLNNNNVYSRHRCNGSWCAIMYEYYFEKDQAACGSGHRHEWEFIIVYVRRSDDSVRRVAHSYHNDPPRGSNSFRTEGKRVKMVYHKDGASTHQFRFANAGDDAIENHTGRWFLGSLVGWAGWPNTGMRDKVLNGRSWSGDGGIRPKLSDGDFTDRLRRGMDGTITNFDPSRDE